MKYKYQPYQGACDEHGELLTYPIVNVTLKYRNKTFNVDCLVDSGASESLFGTDFADILGIDLTNAPPRNFYGIDDTTIEGFESTIKVKLKGFDSWVEINAGFIDQNEMPLLGHSGFFENYEVTFRAKQKRLEIKAIRKSLRHKRRN